MISAYMKAIQVDGGAEFESILSPLVLLRHKESNETEHESF